MLMDQSYADNHNSAWKTAFNNTSSILPCLPSSSLLFQNVLWTLEGMIEMSHESWAFGNHLFLGLWLVKHPCSNCCPLKKEASLTKADSTSLWASKSINIYKASYKAHGVHLAKWWCWYYSFPIWIHILLGYGLLAALQYQTCISPCGWSPNRKELVTPLKIMPLLHQCAHNCLELHRTHSWGSTLLVTFYL